MSGNRFDFLELSGTTPVEPQTPGVAGPDITADPGDAEIGRRVDAHGRPIAQVIDSDVRGYRAFLEQHQVDEPLHHSARHADQNVRYELRPIEVFGGRGIKAGRFNFPAGIAVDSRGVLFVADSYNHRVQRITSDGGVSIIGGRGSGRTQFLSPQAVAVDSNDSFYVVEQGNHRVQKYSSEGVLELVIDAQGHDDGCLFRPTGIAVTKAGVILVADNGNSRVQRFDPDGKFIGVLGPGRGRGQLISPQSVSVDASDYAYVADTFGQCVLRFDPNGRAAGKFGGKNWSASNPDVVQATFLEPRAVAVEANGLMYVADTGDTMADGNPSRGRLQVIDMPTGAAIASFDRLPRNLATLFRPGGLTLSAPFNPGGFADRSVRGDVYVADTMNHRILRFAWFPVNRWL